jgi:hypothetical protein
MWVTRISDCLVAAIGRSNAMQPKKVMLSKPRFLCRGPEAAIGNALGLNWQCELKDRAPGHIWLRPQPPSVSFDNGTADG